VPVAPQEEVDCLDASNKGSIETTVVHSLDVLSEMNISLILFTD